VWWERQSIASFFSARGSLIRSGTAAFWRARERRLKEAVDRLGSGGARVVFVATEPIGLGVKDRCPGSDTTQACSWLRWRTAHYGDITTRWNRTMRAFASAHPDRAAFVSISADICHAIVSPCDDRVAGAFARPLGTHYQGAGAERASRALVDAIRDELYPGAAPGAAPGTIGAPPRGITVMLTGDSVPYRLLPLLRARASARFGWQVIDGTHKACPVSGERTVWKDGHPRRLDCPDVIATQDDLIRRSDPDIVVWWDRFSISHFLTVDGDLIRSGSRPFWTERSAALSSTVDRLTAGGAKVAFVATEPIGIGVRRICPTWQRRACREWKRFQIVHWPDITRRWNRTMAGFARDHPDVAAFMTISDALCHQVVAPCNDLFDGHLLRGDGTHYGRYGRPRAVRELLDELVRAFYSTS
jgi:hypothetical protein